MIKLDEFVRFARDRNLVAQGGKREKSVLIERFVKLGVDDLLALTAEAYNQEVLPSNLPWKQGLAKVKAAINEQSKGATK